MQNQLKRAFAFLLLFSINSVIAQDSLAVKTKTNPIVFSEMYVCFGGANSAGWTIGGTVNYQFSNTDLLTVRLGAYAGFHTELALLAPAVGIPVIKRNELIADYGFLYGKRWIAGGTSFSVSAGISFLHHEYLEEINEDYYLRKENVMGIPFEMNVKFFKKQKRRLRIYYGLIPLTKKKVAFGKSFGFKVVGNIGKANYFAIGISYGIGTHKKY